MSITGQNNKTYYLHCHKNKQEKKHSSTSQSQLNGAVINTAFGKSTLNQKSQPSHLSLHSLSRRVGSPPTEGGLIRGAKGHRAKLSATSADYHFN